MLSAGASSSKTCSLSVPATSETSSHLWLLSLERFGCKFVALQYAPSLEKKERGVVYLLLKNNIEHTKKKL